MAFNRRLASVTPPEYLLRVPFDVANQGYAPAQVVDLRDEGPRDGGVRIIEVDGTLAVAGNRGAFTAQATPAIGDLGFVSLDAEATELGRGLLCTFEADNIGVAGNIYGTPSWGANGLTNAELVYTMQWTNTDIYVRVDPNGDNRLPIVGVCASDTDYQIAIVLGGYDANGVPFHAGLAAIDYLYGAAWYIRGGIYTDWTLLWRTAIDTAAMIYAGAGMYNDSGTIDDFRTPVRFLYDVQLPTALSTFDAPNGTSLDAIVPEVGFPWVERVGNWDIQGNLARTATVINNDLATNDSPISDCMIDAEILTRWTNAANFNVAGIVLRWTDANHHWAIIIDPQANQLRLFENNAGWVLRAFSAIAINDNTTYDVRGIAYAQTIDAFLDGGNKCTFAACAMNEIVTVHGIFYDFVGVPPGDATWNNYAVFARTSLEYDHILDGV